MERFNLRKLKDVEVKENSIQLKSQISLQLKKTWMMMMMMMMMIVIVIVMMMWWWWWWTSVGLRKVLEAV
jgi:ABC-type uncharacterized transport system permease subunit